MLYNEAGINIEEFLNSEKESIVTDLENEWLQMKKVLTRDDLICEDSEDFSGLDVRLRFHEGYLEILTGDSSMDTDYRGFWGYGSLDYDIEPEELTEAMTTLATELIEGVLEQEAISR